MDPNQFNFAAQPPLPAMAHQQPPPIFGNYAAEASYGPDDGTQGVDDGTEHGDAKRRRIARACDMCRKKKIKCDGKMPACTNCQNYKTECIFTHVEKKRQPPKGAKYIEGLENRLGRMESLLRLSGLLSEDDDGQTDLGTLEKRLQDQSTTMKTRREGVSSGSPERDSAPRTEPAVSQEASPTQPESNSTRPSASMAVSPDGPRGPPLNLPPPQNPEDVGNLSDMMCSLLTNNSGETRYIGSSSGFSIFSPKGIQWVSEKTGDSSFRDMVYASIDDSSKWSHWPDVMDELFARRVYQPLPPKHEAQSLCRDYFENFNCIFPLFHEPTFIHLLDAQYAGKPQGGSGWWASLNVVLAIAQRLRVMSRVISKEEDTKSWGYIKNAMGVQTELTMRNTDLLSVQAILGLALFLQGTPNPQPAFFLVAAAIRLAHSIGLHKRGSVFGLTAEESEQRKRVFWIAYMLDRDICLRSGRPPVQDDDDMNVDLPSPGPPDNIGDIPLVNGDGKVNIFRLMVTFSIIQSKVYKQLYCVKAFKQSDGDLLNTIGELDKELEEWKDQIPIDFRPEHEIKAIHTPLLLHVVVLHFAYYNCLATIHRLNVRPLNPRVFSSAALCVTAARASIHLIKYIPATDFACIWLIIYYPVSALVTLFANILQNPQDSRARSDLKLMNAVVSFLSIITADESDTSARRMLSICTEFERIARLVLDRKDRDKNRRGKRKPDGNTSNDDSSPTIGSNGTRSDSQPAGSGSRVATPSGQMGPMRPVAARNGFDVTPGPAGVSTPSFLGDFGGSQTLAGTPGGGGSSGDPRSPSIASPGLLGDLNPMMMPGTPFSPHTLANRELQGAVENGVDGLGDGGLDSAGPFQQPFVPQDLWQMPMALEWDWADMTQVLGGLGGGGAVGGQEDIGMGDADDRGDDDKPGGPEA